MLELQLLVLGVFQGCFCTSRIRLDLANTLLWYCVEAVVGIEFISIQRYNTC